MIKRLELQGFKSFEKKVSIPLSNGFTAIVGPNGSGKSNICDAICFVLGMTSAKSMRAGRLTHLICNGGKKRKPSDFAEVSLIIDNSKKILPFDQENVTVSRRITRNGTMTYKLNGSRTTRSQLVDLLSSSLFNPQGHNIVMQGDITNFIEMDPIQRRGILDEISGIAEYDFKKEKAKKDLDEVESRVKELVIVMGERKKHLDELRKEKKDAERYKKLKDEATELEARLAFTRYKNVEEEESKVNSKLKEAEDQEKQFERDYSHTESILSEKESELKKTEDQLIKQGGTEQAALKEKIEHIKSLVSIDESKIESKRSEISRIDSMVSKLQSIGVSRPLKALAELREHIEGIHGTVGELMSYQPKYARAISSALGGRINFIVVDNEDIAIQCIDYLKENKLGRATFLPLNKMKSYGLKEQMDPGIIGLAINLIDFKKEYQNIFGFALGNTHVVDDLKNTKMHIGKLRMTSLDGDLAEKSGAVTGGYKKEAKGADKEIESYVQSRDQLLDEIEALRTTIEQNKGKLNELYAKDEASGSQLQKLDKTKGELDLEISKLRDQRQSRSIELDHMKMQIADIRVEKARIDAQMTDIKINMKKYKTEGLEEGDIKSMEQTLDQVTRSLIRLEPVNMKAIELYDHAAEDFKDFEEKFNKLREERKSVLDLMDEIETKKKTVFMNVYNKVADEFSRIFPKLSENGEAKILLEDEEDPLGGGLLVEAKPAGKKLLSIELMSGGEKVLTALAFLFSLQRYKPAPFYILDEVDAALDQTNSIRFVDLLQETLKEAQLMVISHNNAVVKNADRVFGVSMKHEGISNIVGLEFKAGELIGA